MLQNEQTTYMKPATELPTVLLLFTELLIVLLFNFLLYKAFPYLYSRL